MSLGHWSVKWLENSQLEAEGKNPFSLDSKEPQWDKFQDYLKGEVLNRKGNDYCRQFSARPYSFRTRNPPKVQSHNCANSKYFSLKS